MDTVREEAWPVGAPTLQQQQQASAPQLVPQQNGRIDLRELKSQMEKRLGPDRSRRYFSYLNDYMSQRLSKPDFDRLCMLTLGRENRQLHSRLIISILYNAYQAKCPPPPDAGRPVAASTKHVSQAAEVFSGCNGDARLLQVQGSRPMGSAGQGHPLKDQMNTMGPNGRAGVAVNHTQVVAHGVSADLENGTVSPLELKRPVHFQQREPAEPLAKHPRMEQSRPDNILLQRKGTSGAARHSMEPLRSPVRAPLGIPFCSASVGGTRKLPPPTNAGEDGFTSCLEHGALFNTELLHRRIEKTAEALGLAGVTMDCAELLNSGLDMYMKNLIRSSVELIGAGVQRNARKGVLHKQQAYGKQINGIWLPNQAHMQSGSGSSGATSDIKSDHLISINDFMVAMQLNPQQLGEDWPVLLEKISLCSSEENG